MIIHFQIMATHIQTIFQYFNTINILILVNYLCMILFYIFLFHQYKIHLVVIDILIIHMVFSKNLFLFYFIIIILILSMDILMDVLYLLFYY